VEGIKRRRHLSEQEWAGVFERFARAGQSVTAFCKGEGLDTSSFHRWRARLGTDAVAKRPAQASVPFVDLGALGASPASSSSRFELKLDLGGGLVLHLVRG
jgi:putative transposase